MHRQFRIAVASLSVVALVSAAIGLAVANQTHGTRPPLVLRVGRGSQPAEPAASGRDLVAPSYRYRLATSPPDLGSAAPVARLEAPHVDEARVRSMAVALGLDGPATRTADGGWEVTHGSMQLTLAPTPGGWDVQFSRDAASSAPGSVPGSTGSGGSGVAGGSGGSGGSGVAGSNPSGGIGVPVPMPSPPPSIPPPPTPPASIAPPPATTAPAPAPVDLPTAAEAERTARALLHRLGVTGDWAATISDTVAGSVTTSPGNSAICKPACSIPPIVVSGLTVALRPVFDTVAVDGISWQIDVGERGTIRAVSGTWTSLRTLGRYPLRPVSAVFDDLVKGTGINPFPVPVSEIAPVAPGGAAPDHVIAPTTVTISRVTLGFAVIPAAENGATVVDVVPTYVFTGRTSAGDEITQTLVAVNATVATPETLPVAPMTAGGAPVT
jgi:hypothetical protein